MGIQQTARGRRPAVAVALVASAALMVSGCGGNSDKGTKSQSSATKSSSTKSTGSSTQDSSPPTPEPTATLAQIKGGQGITVTINSATRDTGGFVTVSGTLTNNGQSVFNALGWRGQEVAVQKSGSSLAGATLVDEAGKKRYYVLRDTEGLCLCTMGLTLISPGETRPIFAQFPAPPKSTTEVDFQLPTMPPAKITISEG
ncbi:hypothetical protein [Actinacidiphila oryziradicis]|uniref:Secreted protein n=1 Tax=Actinacidiphila oryziradicis TaxID=2571141 RepID=A0A4U0S2F4_9ACTN|nr:hypothetical protein [Actinacidiphila oryziradicis]TKA03012.1 hypothetical protein FCI23_37870 [Actinacidiphila oryziradicis]